MFRRQTTLALVVFIFLTTECSSETATRAQAFESISVRNNISTSSERIKTKSSEGNLSSDNVTKHNYNTTTLLSRYQHDPNPSNSRQVQRYHIPPSILHNLDMFSPSNLAKPLREKIERIENFFKYPLHPNYGAINLMNLIRSVKDSILEHKLQGHYQQFDSSPNLGEHDYPFSSRSVGVNGTRKV